MIKPDKYQRIPGGIGISEYLLKNHGYTVPGRRSETPQGVTIVPLPVHFFEECKTTVTNGYIVSQSSDLAEKNIEELTPDGLIPHYIVTRHSNWQLLDLADSWQRCGGAVNSNTLCVGVTMDDNLTSWQYKLIATEHAAMLVAWLLKKYKLSEKSIYIARDCPEFFVSRWRDFRQAVSKQYKKV